MRTGIWGLGFAEAGWCGMGKRRGVVRKEWKGIMVWEEEEDEHMGLLGRDGME